MRCSMKKSLMIVLGCVSLVAMATALEARRHCKPKKECIEECKPACDKTPAKEIHGVLCKAVKVKKERWCPQPDCCVTRSIPCAPVKKVRCVPQPDKEEVIWEKREVCVPQPDKVEIVWEKRVVCVPQPDREEIYWEQLPNKCCEEMIPCPPKRVVDCCIEYVPVDICIDNNNQTSGPECDWNNEQDQDQEDRAEQTAAATANLK